MLEAIVETLRSVAESCAFKIAQSFGLTLSPTKRFALQLIIFAAILIPAFLLFVIVAMFAFEALF